MVEGQNKEKGSWVVFWKYVFKEVFKISLLIGVMILLFLGIGHAYTITFPNVVSDGVCKILCEKNISIEPDCFKTAYACDCVKKKSVGLFCPS